MRKTCLLFIIPACLLLMLIGISCSQDDVNGDGEGTGQDGVNGSIVGGQDVVVLPDDVTGLVALLGQPGQGSQNMVMQKLTDKGFEAVPALIEALKDNTKKSSASNVLVQIGKPAVPVLITALGDPLIVDQVIILLGEIGPEAIEAVDPLKDIYQGITIIDTAQKGQILHSLVKISPDPSVVVLLKISLTQEELQHDALVALAEVGPGAGDAVESILEILKNTEIDNRKNDAINALEAIGPIDGVVEALADMLDYEAADVRKNAAEALGSFGWEAGSATPELEEALLNAFFDKEALVREACATAIGQIAPASREAIDILLVALDEESNTPPKTLQKVVNALANFGSDVSEALPRLYEIAESDLYVVYVKNAAAQAIEAIELQTAGEISALITELGSSDHDVQVEAVQKLANVGEDAIPALIEALDDPGTRLGAGYALVRIGPMSIPALIDALQTEESQYGAITALGEFGPDAIDAVDPLKDLFAGMVVKETQVPIMYNLVKISPTDDVFVVVEIALAASELQHDGLRVLERLGPEAASAADTIVGLLETGTEDIKLDAIATLSSIGAVEGVVDGLAGCLTDDSVDVRMNAALTLGSFGEVAASATQELMDVLADDDEYVQVCVVMALGQLAPASRDSISVLIEKLSSDSANVRFYTVTALGEFGVEALEAVPKLEELEEEDEESSIKSAARDALEKIVPEEPEEPEETDEDTEEDVESVE